MTPPSPTISIRDVLRAEPSALFKSDARSRVWAVHLPGQSLVVKRFEYSPLRQRLQWHLGIHPAQREARLAGELARQGLPVLPVVMLSQTPAGLGLRAVIVTPLRGRELRQLVRRGELAEPGQRRQVLELLAALAGQLFSLGYDFRDFKTSNILLDDSGRLWLIDVGSTRQVAAGGRDLRTLAVLHQALADDGFTAVERRHWLDALTHRHPALGSAQSLADALTRNVLK